MSETVSEYERERREKLRKLRQLGVDPFGQRTENIQPLAEIKGLYKPEMGHDAGPVVSGAGRVMFQKRFGKLAFLTLRDETGDLQIALDKKRLSERDWQVAELIDLGDQIVATGSLGTTKTGEVTIWCSGVAMAAKSLLPPPGKFHGLEDVEQRYRQRYIDLWANPEVMKLAKLRIRIIEEIRNYLRGLGYAEVETPMMQILHGGAAARPFVTHHNALDIDLYMRIAPELFLKRLLVGGMRKVFEINRNFRNEGISPRHNPEFTMLEAYEGFGSWETMADMVEGLVCHLAEKVFGTLQIEHRDPLGVKAVHAFSLADHKPLEDIARARLNLLGSRTDGPEVFGATIAEVRARETGSEGYEGGQAGFDALVQEYRREIEGKPEKEQRELLLKKFTVRTINLARPWRRVRMTELVEERIGWKFDKRPIMEAAPEIYERVLATRFLSHVQQWLGQLSSYFSRLIDDLQGNPETMFNFMRGLEKVSEEDTASLDQLGHRLLENLEGTPEAEVLVRMLRDATKHEAKVMRGLTLLARESLYRLTPAEQLQDIYEKHIEPTLIDPTFVTHIPSVIIPLAKENKEDPFFADVYELAINGVEISPGYTELNDPDVQAKHFAHQVGDKEEQQKTDEDFLNALKHGMPPAGGMGLGVDRLIMMLTGAESIRDVILFPLMKPN